MQARGLVQIARDAAVSAGKAGRERGSSQTPPAFAVILNDEEAHTLFRLAWGWLGGMRARRLVGQDTRASGVRMIVRRLPTGGPWFDLQRFTRRFRSAEAGRKDGTTANERTRTMRSAETAKRLGLLIRNPMTTMGLDNYPKKCGCPKHSYPSNLPDCGATHGPDEPCPFKKYSFPIGILGTCCSLRGKAAARELAALGENRLAEAMHHDMTCVDTEAFAKKLLEGVARIKGKHAGKSAKPIGAGWNGTWNHKTADVRYHDHSTFGHALSTICEASRWYEKVASLGFGVHAWC
jgi:hypothetical protein